ncbi:MAG: pseudouridine synthase [Phycisphaerales bacterium]
MNVLYEDDHPIVLFNKQADIIVHPASRRKSGTLINALAWRFRNVSGGDLSAVGADFARPGVVHRLDRHTSGCIVFAKDDETHWKSLQFEHRKVDKWYRRRARCRTGR